MTPVSYASAPTVSVILPAYNRAGTIRAAVESVLRQTYTDLEVLVVDDGSSDETVARVREIDDPRLRLIEHDVNKGASQARNTGIEAARAPWVAFQDSDDIWLPQKLEQQMARLETHDPESGKDYVAVYCGMLVCDAEGNAETGRYVPGPHVSPKEGDISDMLLRSSFISTQTMVARREHLLDVGGFDPDLPALIDWGCFLRLAQTGPVAFVPDVLVHQVFSENSITMAPGKRLKARLRILETHADLLAKRPDIHALHHYEIAGVYRDMEAFDQARHHLRQARALAPGQLRYWAMAAYLTLRQVLPGQSSSAG